MDKNKFDTLCACVCEVFDEFKRECEALLTAKETTEQAYQRGLDEAWEAARKLYMEYTKGEIAEILGMKPSAVLSGMNVLAEAFVNHSVSEAIAKIREYEEKKKAEDEAIKVGDEIVSGEAHVVVTFVDCDDWNGILLNDCANGESGHCYTCMESFSGWHKTGRHFSQIAEILGQIASGDRKKQNPLRKG